MGARGSRGGRDRDVTMANWEIKNAPLWAKVKARAILDRDSLAYVITRLLELYVTHGIAKLEEADK